MSSTSMSHRKLCGAAVVALACVSVEPAAQPSPPANANADAGKALHDKDCVACHETALLPVARSSLRDRKSVV